MQRSFFHYENIFLIILVFISFSCANSKKKAIAYTTKINGNDVLICPIDKVTDSLVVQLSSLIESLEIIKLQTTPEAFFGQAWQTEISDKYISVISYNQLPVKLFDKSGKFLRNIGVVGRGPGEYSSLNGVQFNQKGDMLFLFPYGSTRKILVYDVLGNQHKDIPLAFTQQNIKAYFSKDSIITILSMPFKSDSAICFQQSFNGKLIQKLSPPPYLINESFDGGVFTNYLPEFDYFNTASDTLYHYNPKKNTLEPKFAIAYRDKKFYSVNREMPGYYYFDIFGPEVVSSSVLVNKKTLDAKYFNLQNDFFGNTKASAEFSNGYFINNVAAITLKKQIEYVLKRSKLTDKDRKKLNDFNNNLTQEDNNIIFCGRLKQN
jgi:hypothetical protein